MNSIDIAKKLIEENNETLDVLRARAADSLKKQDDYKKEIKNHKEIIEALERHLANEERWYRSTHDEIKEYLVDNLALKNLIADGGGFDMY